MAAHLWWELGAGGGGQPWPRGIKIYTLKQKRWMGHWKQLSPCNAITSFMCIVKLEYLNPDPRSWFCWQFPDFFPPFCFYAAVGLWNWNCLLFKRSWRFLQMWKVSFRRPFQRFGYYQKIDLIPWMRYHLCQVTSPQVFWGRLYVDTPCLSPHHFLAVDRGHDRWVTLLECSRNGCIATNTDFIETFFFF